jgi:hypothetical protein
MGTTELGTGRCAAPRSSLTRKGRCADGPSSTEESAEEALASSALRCIAYRCSPAGVRASSTHAAPSATLAESSASMTHAHLAGSTTTPASCMLRGSASTCSSSMPLPISAKQRALRAAQMWSTLAQADSLGTRCYGPACASLRAVSVRNHVGGRRNIQRSCSSCLLPGPRRYFTATVGACLRCLGSQTEPHTCYRSAASRCRAQCRARRRAVSLTTITTAARTRYRYASAANTRVLTNIVHDGLAHAL